MNAEEIQILGRIQQNMDSDITPYQSLLSLLKQVSQRFNVNTLSIEKQKRKSFVSPVIELSVPATSPPFPIARSTSPPIARPKGSKNKPKKYYFK